MKSKIIALLRNVKRTLRKIVERLKSFYLSIGSSKECPICKWTGHSFSRHRLSQKKGSFYVCPSCGSSERHRLAYYLLKKKLVPYSEKILHFAPESCIEPWLRSISKDYLSVDLCSPKAMQRMDITNITLGENSFSLAWCSHVLEHIENDSKAMSELLKVLRPAGLAVIMVPIYGETTYEDFTIVSPQERLKHFKQKDHVRLYGKDIKDRLEKTGFYVETISTSDVPEDDVARFHLEYTTTKEIFLCKKPKAA